MDIEVASSACDTEGDAHSATTDDEPRRADARDIIRNRQATKTSSPTPTKPLFSKQDAITSDAPTTSKWDIPIEWGVPKNQPPTSSIPSKTIQNDRKKAHTKRRKGKNVTPKKAVKDQAFHARKLASHAALTAHYITRRKAHKKEIKKNKRLEKKLNKEKRRRRRAELRARDVIRHGRARPELPVSSSDSSDSTSSSSSSEDEAESHFYQPSK